MVATADRQRTGSGCWRTRRGVASGLRTGGEDGDGVFDRPWTLARSSSLRLDDVAGGREWKWLRCSEQWLRDGSRGCCAAVTTIDRRRARDAERGTVDLAFHLDGDVVSGVLMRGGGLQRRRLPSAVVLGGDVDGDNAGLDGWRHITGDAKRRLDGCISCYPREEARREACLRPSNACADAGQGAPGADDKRLEARYQRTAGEEVETLTDAEDAAQRQARRW